MAGAKGWTADEDLSGASVERPKQLENGIYYFEVTGYDADKPTSNGNAQITVHLKAVGRYGSDESLDGFSCKIRDFVTVMKETFWKVSSLADAASVAPPTRTNQGEIQEFGDRLLDAGRLIASTKQTHSPKHNAYFANVDAYLTEAQAAELAAGGVASSNGESEGGTRKKKGRRNASASA